MSVVKKKKHIHRVSNVNPQSRRGTCAECGPNVPLYRINNKTAGVISWRCKRGSRAQTVAFVSTDGTHRIRISPEDRQVLYDLSNGVCDICNDPLTLESMRPDHQHGTVDIRGALCHRCNLGLGYFKDSVESLSAAIAYLEEYQKSGCVLKKAIGDYFTGYLAQHLPGSRAKRVE